MALENLGTVGAGDERADDSRQLGTLLADHRWIDLTAVVAEDLPCWWPQHMQFQHKTFNWFADANEIGCRLSDRLGQYQTRWMLIDEHTGTHLDAPVHFIPPPGSGLEHAGPAGLVSIEDVELTQAVGPSAVLDVSSLVGEASPGASPTVPPELVTAWERDHGEISAGDVVLFHTGWDRYYQPGEAGDDYAYNVLIRKSKVGWPVPAVETLELLLERGVRCVGIDAPSVGAAEDPSPQHICALRQGAVFVEVLVGLSELPARGSYFMFFPLKLRDGTGGPGRAVGLVRSSR